MLFVVLLIFATRCMYNKQYMYIIYVCMHACMYTVCMYSVRASRYAHLIIDYCWPGVNTAQLYIMCCNV